MLKEGYDKIWIILDNNSTHKKKMQRLLQHKLDKLYTNSNLEKLIEITFDYTPPYSPDYNLAEYVIRIIRQKITSPFTNKLHLRPNSRKTK